MKPLANRIEKINPFIVMTILERAIELERKGKDIIHFEIGEPDFDSPKPILDAAKSACDQNKTHYTHSQGNFSLREAIASYKSKTRKINPNPATEIIVTSGTSPAFFLVMGSIIEPGDEIIIANPSYSCYPNFIQFFGGIPHYVDVFEEEKFDFNPHRLEQAITSKTKAILINSPSNPTGQIIAEKTLKKIADLAIKHDLYVISDEIYSEITYSSSIAPSISSIPEMKDRTIILDGFSKFWAMTGWRLGYVIAPDPITQMMNKVNQNFNICAPSISQEAGLAALQCEEYTQKMLHEYQNRRDFLIKRVKTMSQVTMIPPAGAFYAFLNVKQITQNSLKLSLDLLEQAHIATTPGIGFGSNGEGYLRLSYCTDIPKIDEGMNRLEKFLQKKRI